MTNNATINLTPQQKLFTSIIGDDTVLPALSPPVFKKRKDVVSLNSTRQEVSSSNLSRRREKAKYVSIHVTDDLIVSDSEDDEGDQTRKYLSFDQQPSVEYFEVFNDDSLDKIVYRPPANDAEHLKYISFQPDSEVLVPGLKQLQVYHAIYQDSLQPTPSHIPASSFEPITSKKKRPANPDIFVHAPTTRSKIFKFSDIIDWVLRYLYFVPTTSRTHDSR